MRQDRISIRLTSGKTTNIPVYSLNTLIIGAGAAALKCADTLYHLGVRDIAIIVDKLGNGTSNNSGSDKQSYYKIGLSGDNPDSPMDFARTLFQGGMMHGDIAYVEALGSAPAFFDLCKIGVPFPFNKYGAYVGFKTDYDPKQRATSAGPKTSMMMFRQLLKQVQRNKTPIFNYHEAVKLLYTDEGNNRRVIGALCLNKEKYYRNSLGLTAFNTENIVMGTGGPGEMYKISVWPHGQLGSHGLALEIGAIANNLTELQFGLASVKFRWNLSGTYQQVIPDYFSTNADGISNKRFFLNDYFNNISLLATNIFLKGYQWPFDAARLQSNGSSLIDIAVQNEISEGRRVFMDFMHNPTNTNNNKPFRIAELHDEAKIYLERSGTLQEIPYKRLEHMNPQSIEIFKENGIDLHEPLEVAVCAQHCNGGISGNIWWESNIKHLFTIGELTGTHGIRPGGSALNSGQVGAMRAAQYISNIYRKTPISINDFTTKAEDQIKNQLNEYYSFLHPGKKALEIKAVRHEIQERMSKEGALIRSLSGSGKALEDAYYLYRNIQAHGMKCSSPKMLCQATENKMLALTSIGFLESIIYYIENGGGSRGCYIIVDNQGDCVVSSKNEKYFRYRSKNFDKRKEILEVQWDGRKSFKVYSVSVRPLPVDDSWFENVWNSWNEGKIFEDM